MKISCLLKFKFVEEVFNNTQEIVIEGYNYRTVRYTDYTAILAMNEESRQYVLEI